MIDPGKAYLEDALRTANLFNGRLLSAEDLRDERAAVLARQERLGRAIGDGILSGLSVSALPAAPGPAIPQPVVRVTAGVAITPEGESLQLANTVDVLLQPSVLQTTITTSGGDFTECASQAPSASLASGGVFLLTVCAAHGSAGLASINGQASAACTAKYDLEGVSFRVLALNIPSTELTAATEPRLRNRVAYRCYGYLDADPAPLRWIRDPFAQPAPGESVSVYAQLNRLVQSPVGVLDREVPLAVVYWKPGIGFGFVDMWSVRRRPGWALSVSAPWASLLTPRLPRLAEAMMLQFEDQAVALLAGGPPVLELFSYWPPAGLLAFSGATPADPFLPANTALARLGITYASMLEADAVACLFNEALLHQPINLDLAVDPTSRPQFYYVEENLKAIRSGDTTQLIVVFSNRTVPLRFESRFPRFGFANFSRDRFV